MQARINMYVTYCLNGRDEMPCSIRRNHRLQIGATVVKSKVGSEQLSEDDIRRLVDAFYAKVRSDPDLAPLFERAIPGDWGPHLATMRDFWSSLMLASGRYKGNPLAVHMRIDGITAQLFERWLELFGETCGELFDAKLAEAFCVKAERIAESFRLGLFYRPDRRWRESSS